ncbi:DNA alkylation repair protein [Arthrobacter sp. NPDC058288]|uniref:DNA alkylation repair protein n=1 Tax=Arthrobacter sp. NPDC058288 TaxID=3346424 RepID=UPI0036E651A0
MTDACDFVDASLQRESSWLRADESQARLGDGLQFYGASVGAVRGTIRDMLRRHRDLGHDDITALSTELWSVPVFERRLAAVVLLQSRVAMLNNSDLTRIEGFVREAQLGELVDPLAADVVRPLVASLEGQARTRAHAVLERWAGDPDPWLRRAAVLSLAEAAQPPARRSTTA